MVFLFLLFFGLPLVFFSSSILFSSFLSLLCMAFLWLFIKPENAMRSPLNNEATDHCYCKSNGDRGASDSGLVRWKRWTMFLEMTLFSWLKWLFAIVPLDQIQLDPYISASFIKWSLDFNFLWFWPQSTPNFSFSIKSLIALLN